MTGSWVIGGFLDMEETIRDQLTADILSEQAHLRRGRDNLIRGLTADQTTPSPSLDDVVPGFADHLTMVAKAVVDHPTLVDRLSDGYLIRLNVLDDQFAGGKILDIRHNMRERRNMIRSYLEDNWLLCSAESIVDDAQDRIRTDREALVNQMDQDVLARFDAFCRKQRMATSTAMKRWTQAGIRAVVLSGTLAGVPLQTGLQRGLTEARQTIHNPTQYLE